MPTKLYIGNLPYEHDQRDLEEEFARFGKIAHCAVKHGFAFIHFENEEDAVTAVKEMDGNDWRGRQLRVAMSISRSGGSDRGNRDAGHGSGAAPLMSKSLFVANIAPDVRLSELEDLFETFGKVADVKILPQARGNVCMSAFVDFHDVASAEKAHTTELTLCGQRLRTDYSIPRGNARRSEGADDGRRQHHSSSYDNSDARQHHNSSYNSHNNRQRDYPSSSGRDSFDGRSPRRDHAGGHSHHSHHHHGDRRSRSRSREHRSKYDDGSSGRGDRNDYGRNDRDRRSLSPQRPREASSRDRSRQE